MSADAEGAEGDAGEAVLPFSAHADTPPAYDPSQSAAGDIELGREESTVGRIELGREESTVGDLQPSDTFKKKKKKRVSGIAFAVQVEEQVIHNNAEEMQRNREHWQAIQDKVNDPSTVSNGIASRNDRPPSLVTLPAVRWLTVVRHQVYSNDNSRTTSGSASPMRTITKERAEGANREASADTLMHEGTNVVPPVTNMLCPEELGNKVMASCAFKVHPICLWS